MYDEQQKYLKISFILPKGAYATEFIKQLLNNF
jgi:tRNA(Glu) U13 pseudouridine synthase TruD